VPSARKKRRWAQTGTQEALPEHLLCRWLSTGKDCPETVECPPWRSPKAAWTWLWAPCSGCPAGTAAGPDGPRGPSPPPPFSASGWFCEALSCTRGLPPFCSECSVCLSLHPGSTAVIPSQVSRSKHGGRLPGPSQGSVYGACAPVKVQHVPSPPGVFCCSAWLGHEELINPSGCLSLDRSRNILGMFCFVVVFF